MNKLIVLIFLLSAVPAFAGNNWYVHNGTDHWEGHYTQAGAEAMALDKGWTAVEGLANVPPAVKNGQIAKEALAKDARNANRATGRSNRDGNCANMGVSVQELCDNLYKLINENSTWLEDE